jgi:DNA replication protein DnaC
MKPSPALLKEYDSARQEAIAAAELRKQATFAAIPRFKEIAREKREAAYQIGQALLHGDSASAQREQQLKSLQAEEQKLLQEAGVAPSFLEPQFRCPLCADTGYVGYPQKSLCACLRQRILDEEFSRSGLREGERFEAFLEDIYSGDKQRREALAARDACLSYAQNFPDNTPRGLLLLGKTGLGKSFLLRATAAHILERGYSVVYLTAYAFIATVLERIQSHLPMPDYLAPDFLVLDDLGAEPMINNITKEQLCALLDSRQSAGKATAVASNLSPFELMDTYGDRFGSRLLAPRETKHIQLFGKNLRNG